MNCSNVQLRHVSICILCIYIHVDISASYGRGENAEEKLFRDELWSSIPFDHFAIYSVQRER